MKFLKTIAATIIGFFVSLFIIAVLFFIFIVVVASFSGPSEPKVPANTVLVMKISGKLPARTQNNPIINFFGSSSPTTSLKTLKTNLRKARADQHIEGVVLKINQVHAGWANLQEAYRAIEKFRKSSDKFIYAATNDVGFNEKAYYLASAADSVFSPPLSYFEFDGFYTQVMFIKGLLDKLGIGTFIARHGKFKSAVEPLMRKSMSSADKKQLSRLLHVTTHNFLKAVSRKSGQSISQLNTMLNKAPHLRAKFAYQQNMIDSLLYLSQLNSLVQKRIGLKENEHLNTISGKQYTLVNPEDAGIQQANTNKTIAVLYVNGIIMNGIGHSTSLRGSQTITASWFRKQLNQITHNPHVKGLVLRINSPGGSGSASDVIWHLIRKTTEKMPVVVSMGPVCASGGYYIASAADAIVANPTTITGSIGVFSIHFDASKFFNNKLGITFDNVESNKHADWLSPVHEFTPVEKKAFKASVTAFYHTFLKKVAKGRNMSIEQVNDIAQGRVWSGKDAKKHGLVDKLGGLRKAIHLTAKKAGLTHYNILRLPRPKGFIKQILSGLGYEFNPVLSTIFGGNDQLKTIQQKIRLLKKRGALLLFPYRIRFK